MALRKPQGTVRADDGTEENVDRILLMTVEEMARRQSHEEAIFGSRAVAATWATEKLLDRHDLDKEYA